MDTIKQLWPMPFSIKEKDVSSFIVNLVIFAVICAVAGFVIGILAKIPLLGLIFALLGWLVEIYSTVGVILCILVFLGVVKK